MDANGVSAPYIANQPGRGNPAANDPNMLINHFAGLNLGPMAMPNNPASMPMGHAPSFVMGPDGQHFMLSQMQAAQHMGMGQMNDNNYQNYQMGYGTPYIGMHMPVMPYTPGRLNAAPARNDRGHSDVPALENRRGSYSTNESTPATPFYGAVSQRDNGPRVASLDRSAYTTPSPQQMGLTSLHVDAAKPVPSSMSDRAIEELLKKNPPIPKAVPAVFTPPGQMKTLDQSIENRIPGNRNVYIRGLHPTTDDELLFQFTARFGAVETSKAIIDTGTGACKGFGFAKFYDVQDSEKCIRGFHRLGYEVGFARESFNSRLKAEGDEGSTNLYISNLPKTLTEVELGTIFLGYTILSSKILRDSMGNSRGVGFARFENRDVCDKVIRKFNGVGIGEEGLLMNIRYADTPSQKELKRVTAERRQFRTNEYNIGAYGTPLVGMSPTMYGQQSHWRRNIPTSRSGNSSSADGSNAVSHTGSQHGQSQTATSSSAEAPISTPTSSECDEGVTIHADVAIDAVPIGSAHSSPSAKKEAAKKEAAAKKDSQ